MNIKSKADIAIYKKFDDAKLKRLAQENQEKLTLL